VKNNVIVHCFLKQFFLSLICQLIIKISHFIEAFWRTSQVSEQTQIRRVINTGFDCFSGLTAILKQNGSNLQFVFIMANDSVFQPGFRQFLSGFPENAKNSTIFNV